jgi:uncharacterized protein YdeI (YjbR/CyaY-like superfamily)
MSAGAEGTVIMEKDRKGRKVDIPHDLSAALRRVKGATSVFAKLAPSHQKEYIEWVQSAKRPETRKRRIAKAVEMIAEGGRSKG